MNDETKDIILHGIQELQTLCHKNSADGGWWTNLKDNTPISPFDPNIAGMKIALIHSEVSEALEGVRKNTMDSHLPHRKTEEVEFADAIIRIMDLAGARGMDVAGAIVEKLEYNKQREDHKIENRVKDGGKSI
jgi:NTP pyrophosphatase (non-canonical NTP hydrolase)